MEEALIKILKSFATSLAIASDKLLSSEQTVECFLSKAELALSEDGKQQLINHIEQLWN